MLDALLATKFYIPPARSELVRRERLIARLNEGVERRLTLVSAPAGFGKTTLLSVWAEQSRVPVGWLTLDESDNDPARFWAYVVTAIQQQLPGLGAAVLSALRAPQSPPPSLLLTDLLNELVAAGPEPLAVVIDDYHLIHLPVIHNDLYFVLNHLPAHVHLILSTRADPPLPLGRLRGRGEINELRAADLRFLPDETSVYLNELMGLSLPPESVEALEQRTDGWVAGLQMAAFSLQGRNRAEMERFVEAFTGSNRYVLDYLTEEVLLSQPETVQDFLLRTSILERLTAGLCDAVTGRDDGREMLERLDAANLFITPFDDERRWYGYHRLFSDLLRNRLARLYPADVASLHLRASEWYEREGYPAEAINHALASGDMERSADVIERHVDDVFYRGEMVQLHQWLKSLPEEAIRVRPALCLAFGWVYLQESIEVAERWVEQAEATLATGGELLSTVLPSGERLADRVASQAATFRVYASRVKGEPPQKRIELARQALAVTPEGNVSMRGVALVQLGVSLLSLGEDEAAAQAFRQARHLGESVGNRFLAFRAISFLAGIALLRGRLSEAAAICREPLREIVEPLERAGQHLPSAGLLYLTLGRVHLERNELAEAESALDKALQLTRLLGEMDALADAHFARAYVHAARGENIPDLSQLAAQFFPALVEDAAAHQARLNLLPAAKEPGRTAAALRWAETRRFQTGISEREIARQLALVRVHLARFRSGAQPDLEAAEAFLGRQLAYVRSRGWTLLIVETLALLALTLQAGGKQSRAAAVLREALALAEPEQIAWAFIGEGEPMAQLLARLMRQPLASNFVAGLSAALGRVNPAEETAPMGLSEPLSRREVEILQLMAEGLSNAEIGQALVIAPGTVKKHSANIFAKLGVHNRSRAVNQARRLGILRAGDGR